MNKKLGLIACATVLQLMHAGSQAAVVINIQEVGLDVVATGTGTLNLAGFNLSSASVPFQSALNPGGAFVVVGGPGVVDGYVGVLNGPSNFGFNIANSTLSGNGGLVGFSLGNGLIIVPAGYVTNGPLLGLSTFSGESLSSLGATPGTYSYVLGNGDSFTVQIGPVAAVPEPSSVAMMFAGIAFVASVGARRRSARKASSQGIS